MTRSSISMLWLWYGNRCVWYDDCYGMVWMVWYGNCYGMVWMVWYEWYGMIWPYHGMVYGMVWMVWYDVAIPWYGIVMVWMVWYDMAIPWHGIWYGIILLWYGMIPPLWICNIRKFWQSCRLVDLWEVVDTLLLSSYSISWVALSQVNVSDICSYCLLSLINYIDRISIEVRISTFK